MTHYKRNNKLKKNNISYTENNDKLKNTVFKKQFKKQNEKSQMREHNYNSQITTNYNAKWQIKKNNTKQ